MTAVDRKLPAPRRASGSARPMSAAPKIAVLLALMATPLESAEEANYDEAMVPAYTLPDPLVDESGQAVATPGQWWEKRRPEILGLFEQHVYGAAAPGPTAEQVTFEVVEEGESELAGGATRRQVRVTVAHDGREIGFDLLLYLPARRNGAVPVLLGLNFDGNHAVVADPAVRITGSWVPERAPGAVDNRATEASRGGRSERWDVPAILRHGFAFATAYCGDIDPDFDDGNTNGLHQLFPDMAEGGANLSTIGAWAWGLSRALDYLIAAPETDGERVAVFGFSRLGKTALWAGARDQRFALVISHQSGCGGAALSRRAFGETVARINRVFPHWFSANFKRFGDNEAALPVDQHQLMALVAPRPLYVGSAVGDRWSDPHGEFLSAQAASPVYELLGGDGVGADSWPEPGNPAEDGDVAYHIREGKHSVTPYDWERYMVFAARHLGKAGGGG